MPRAPILFPAMLMSLPLAAGAANAQPGYDWVTIGAPSNPAYNGPDPFNLVTGRGSTSYEYRMGRMEVTTQQWLDFYNTFSARADAPLDLVQPILWGAERDPNYTGPGVRYRLRNVPNAGMIPVGGVDWRTCAKLCNWLCNDRGTSLSAIANGAYDTSTFAIDANGNWTDQLVHNPGAQFWIPTLDEWLKAVHYDPNRNGPGQGGYWRYADSSDTAPIYGLPGSGQANAGFTLPGNAQYDIPLGSYPTSLSPWGLLDTAGGTSEWMESLLVGQDVRYRFLDGSHFGSSGSVALDSVFTAGGDAPYSQVSYLGVRLASAVPSPSGCAVLGISFGLLTSFPRRRLRWQPAQESSCLPPR